MNIDENVMLANGADIQMYRYSDLSAGVEYIGQL
jgi:hypothetical protein